MERRLQNSLWALGAALIAALLLSGLRPVDSSPSPRLADPATNDAGAIVTGSVDADPATVSPHRHRSLRRHGLSMPYFSFSSAIGG
jgi:hypothetical protein